MDDQMLLRYSRQILLPEIDVEGQQALLDARALVVGAGGLGSPAAMYLAAAGVGTLVLADHDTVDLTNLQRQIMHSADMVGLPKVASARATLHRLNPQTRLEPIQARLEGEALEAEVGRADVVLDCTDNFATRHAINRACVKHRKPLVSGAAIRFDGQVSVFDLRKPDSGCYHCLFPEGEDIEEVRCAVMGVFAPIVGIVGTIQAAEALKVLIGCGRTLDGRLLLLDGLSMEWRSVALGRDHHGRRHLRPVAQDGGGVLLLPGDPDHVRRHRLRPVQELGAAAGGRPAGVRGRLHRLLRRRDVGGEELHQVHLQPHLRRLRLVPHRLRHLRARHLVLRLGRVVRAMIEAAR